MIKLLTWMVLMLSLTAVFSLALNYYLFWALEMQRNDLARTEAALEVLTSVLDKSNEHWKDQVERLDAEMKWYIARRSGSAEVIRMQEDISQ